MHAGHWSILPLTQSLHLMTPGAFRSANILCGPENHRVHHVGESRPKMSLET